jgi:hypothetical protein
MHALRNKWSSSHSHLKLQLNTGSRTVDTADRNADVKTNNAQIPRTLQPA